jgi:hypothetical protein
MVAMRNEEAKMAVPLFSLLSAGASWRHNGQVTVEFTGYSLTVRAAVPPRVRSVVIVVQFERASSLDRRRRVSVVGWNPKFGLTGTRRALANGLEHTFNRGKFR